MGKSIDPKFKNTPATYEILKESNTSLNRLDWSENSFQHSWLALHRHTDRKCPDSIETHIGMVSVSSIHLPDADTAWESAAAAACCCCCTASSRGCEKPTALGHNDSLLLTLLRKNYCFRLRKLQWLYKQVVRYTKSSSDQLFLAFVTS